MKKKKLLAVMAAVMTATIALTACGQRAGDNKPHNLTAAVTDVKKAPHPEKQPDVSKNRKDTLIVGVDTPDGVFNPLYSESAYDVYIMESMFDGVFDIDAQGNPIPGIAKSWDISSDGTVYTFHLRDDVKFSDGTPVTADDIAFTYTVASDPSYTGVIDTASIGIKGFKDFNEGTATEISGIKVIDKNTISFTLDKANASAIYSLGTGILSKAYYGKDYKKGDTSSIEKKHQQPMGPGQYKFVKYTEGQEVDLVANDTYWKGAPKIKNLIYKATSEDTRMQELTTGQIDIDMVTVNPENVQTILDAGFCNIQIFPTNGYGYIGMNVKNPMFNDPKVRQALTYGLDRKSIVDSVYKGYAKVLNEPASRVSWTYTDDVNKYDYDQKKAEDLLAEAGWKKGSDGILEKDGKKFEIHFSASTPNPVNDAIIPIAKKNYEALGIKFIPEQMQFNAVRAKVNKGDFEMFFMAWGLVADPDPTAIFSTGGSQNRTFYSNATVDQLCKDGLAETNKEKRKEIYAKLWKEINKDLPYIFMYQRSDCWVINDRIKNIETTPYKDFTYDLWKAEIK